MSTSPLFIRGWGSVSALGADTRAALRGLREGRRGLGPARYSGHLVSKGTHRVGEAPVDVPLESRPRAIVERAVAEAVEMAGPATGRTGVFVGTTTGYFVASEIALHVARQVNPTAQPQFVQRGPGEVAEHVARLVDARGPVLTHSMACTSSAASLAAAGDHLRAGTCDRAVVVGFDLLSNLTLRGFTSLMLVDPEPCRPFDAARAGLQLGEGCGVLVVDRGRPGPFSLLGSTNVLDTRHLTASSSDGSTAERVIRGAIEASGLEPGQICSIKAHGTGTRDNDLAEGRGIARVFGSAPPRFASLKGQIGHTLGAAGALEVALWLAALAAGFRPGSVGFTETDPEIGIAPAASSGAAPRGAHLFNAFGFGGSCVSLVVADA